MLAKVKCSKYVSHALSARPERLKDCTPALLPPVAPGAGLAAGGEKQAIGSSPVQHIHF